MSAHFKALETAVSFIETHLQDDITIGDIAAAAAYSLYHFCRIFNQSAHHPPYDYLMRRRLSAAAEQLNQDDTRIIDLAFTYHFGSPESFSRAFRRMFGVLPTRWRQQGLRDPRVLMTPLSAKHLAQRNHPAFRRPTPLEKEAFSVAGLMTVVDQDGETAVSHLQRRFNQYPSHNLVTIRHYPDFWAEEGKPVLAGVLSETAAPPFVLQTIPAHTYACFALPAVAEERPFLSDYIYQTWLPQSPYTLAAPFELEQARQVFIPIKPDL
jgi:AraC family transcriptional regulator